MNNEIVQSFKLTGKDQTTAAFKSFRSNVSTAQGAIQKMIAPLLALSGAAGFGLLIKNSFDTGDALAKFARRIGVTNEALAGLQHAAQQSAGVTDKTLNVALQRMTRRVAEASQGLGESKAAIAELGLDAKKLADLSPDQQFYAISDAMKNIPERADQVRLAFKLFDSEGVALVNTLDLGSEGLKQYADQAKDLGLAMSAVDTNKLEMANDALDNARKRTIGLANTLAVAAAPAITAMANAWVDTDNAASGFAQNATTGIDFVVDAIAVMANAVNGLKVVWLLLRQGVAEVLQAIMLGMVQFVTNIETTYNTIASIIPGLQSADLTSALREVYVGFAATNDGLLEELKRAAEAPTPGEKIKRYYAEAKAAAEAAVPALKTFNDDLYEPGTVNLTGAGNTAALKLKDDGEQVLAALANVENSLLSEEQQRTAAIGNVYNQRLTILETSLRRGLISRGRFNELAVGLAEQREKAITDIEAEEAKKRRDLVRSTIQGRLDTTASLFQAFDNLSQAGEATNKKAFKQQKAFSYASAIATGFAAINRGWAEGGFVGAGIATINTLANIRKIANLKYGGGASGAATAAPTQTGLSSPGTIVPKEETAAPNVVVMIEGVGMEQLISKISTTVQRTGADLVPAASANGRRLRTA